MTPSFVAGLFSFSVLFWIIFFSGLFTTIHLTEKITGAVTGIYAKQSFVTISNGTDWCYFKIPRRFRSQNLLEVYPVEDLITMYIYNGYCVSDGILYNHEYLRTEHSYYFVFCVNVCIYSMIFSGGSLFFMLIDLMVWYHKKMD
jgi:hypothetical protein